MLSNFRKRHDAKQEESFLPQPIIIRVETRRRSVSGRFGVINVLRGELDRGCRLIMDPMFIARVRLPVFIHTCWNYL